MRQSKSGQHGAIFLALVLIMLVTGSTLLLAALNNRQTAVANQQTEMRREMQAAKQALLAYAATVASNFGDGPGHLPCPDLIKDTDPTPEPDCDPSTEYLGRLPEYVELTTLDPATGQPHRFYLSRAYAEIDQQFWYAVSPEYLHTDTGGLQANSNTAGTLSVDGTSDIVAVIIAPGEALDQDRASGPDDYAQYLEGGNGVNSAFWTSYQSNPDLYNDVVLPITKAELWSMALTEVAKTIKVRIDNARSTGCASYPRAFVNPSNCGFNFSSAVTNFRTVMNATAAVSPSAPAPTWIMSTSASITGEQNWMGIISSYSGTANTASIVFTGCTALTFTFNYTNNTTIRTGNDC